MNGFDVDGILRVRTSLISEAHQKGQQFLFFCSRRQRSVDSRKHLFFSKNLKQVIEAWSYITASHSETCGVNDCAEFSRGALPRCFLMLLQFRSRRISPGH